MKRPTVLITGASTGLGLSLAKLLLSIDKYHLILTAREESISRFKTKDISENENTWIRPLDVTCPYEREKLIDEITSELNGVDILINNAGIAYRSVVEHVTEAERVAQMDINFLGPMELIRLSLPKMREKRKGKIINVSSVGGMMAMPTMAAYSASKFALEGATESLYYEVKPWNVSVSLIEPGFINSSSFQNVRYTDMSCDSQDNPSEPYYHHYKNMSPFIEKMMGTAIATPEKVAKKILKVMENEAPPLRVPATIDAIVFDILRRVLPRRLYHWILFKSLPGVRQWSKVNEN